PHYIPIEGFRRTIFTLLGVAHDLHTGGDLEGRDERAIHRAALRVDAMDAFHRLAHGSRIFGLQMVGHVYPPDDQHAAVVFHFTADIAGEAAIFGIDFARIQRA